MMNRGAFLGQVPIREGTGFQSPIQWPGGFGPQVPPPAGAPLTREITSPEGWETNLHCYRLPDGSYQTIRKDHADARMAAGEDLEPASYENCPGYKGITAPSTAVMSGGRLGQESSPSPSPGGTPGPSVSPIVHNGGDVQFVQPFQRYYPYFYPVYVQPPPERGMICRRLEDESEEEGRDVFECHPRRGRQMFTYPLFPVARPLGFW